MAVQIKACDDWLGRLTESKERLNGMPELHTAFDHYKIKVRIAAVTFDCHCGSEGRERGYQSLIQRVCCGR